MINDYYDDDDDRNLGKNGPGISKLYFGAII